MKLLVLAIVLLLGGCPNVENPKHGVWISATPGEDITATVHIAPFSQPMVPILVVPVPVPYALKTAVQVPAERPPETVP